MDIPDDIYYNILYMKYLKGKPLFLKKNKLLYFSLTATIILVLTLFLNASAQSITVTTPAGGENWALNSSQSIEWTSAGISDNVSIEYSPTGSCGTAAWSPIVTDTPNDGSFGWTVTGETDTDHVIKITSLTDPKVSGQSAAFTIVPAPEITVTSPTGSESWPVGSVQTITWTSAGISGDVVIQYARETCGEKTWLDIANPALNSGNYDWTVAGEIGSHYVIKISSSNDLDIFDESESFLVVSPSAVYATGRNADYQLGDGTGVSKNTWTLSGFTGTVSSICAARYNSYIITDTGELWGVGSNSNGQLGLGHNEPVTEWTKLTEDVVQVAGGVSFTIYLATDGTVYTAGRNDYGQLGTGDNTSYNTWQQMTTSAKNVAAGYYHTLVTKTDHILYGCGRNDSYQLGKNSTTHYNYLTDITTGVDFARAGLAHTLIRKTTGALYACGNNSYGQIGLGSGSGDDKAETPEYIHLSVTDMACGANYSILNRNGSLWAAGYNAEGELGAGFYSIMWGYIFQPIGANFPDNGRVVAVRCGTKHTVVLTDENKIYTCGLNSSGQLNHGDNRTGTP